MFAFSTSIHGEGYFSRAVYAYMRFYVHSSPWVKDHQPTYYFSWKIPAPWGKKKIRIKRDKILWHPICLVCTEIMHPGEQIEGKKKSSFLLHFPPCQRTLHAAGTSVAIPVPSVKTKASLRLDKSPRPSLRGVKANSVPLSRGYLWM